VSEADLLPVRAPDVASMRLSDGTRLDADIYRPDAPGAYPVLLMRQAYGRRIASAICYAHPSWYAAHGYVVVIQDVRGRGTSEGRFRALENEIADGAETVAWAAKLPGTTGAVGMYGFSYQGIDQLAAAIKAGPALKALAPAMFPAHPRYDWAFENGALRLQGALGWATQIAADTARHEGEVEAYAELYAAARSLPLYERIAARPAHIERHRALTHYHQWLETPDEAPYWQGLCPILQAPLLAESAPPILFIGGWYDAHLCGTLASHHAIAGGRQRSDRLIVGPWIHFPWQRKVGALDFGPDAANSIDELQIRWFDHWLKQRDTGIAGTPPIRLYDVGARHWRDFTNWPKGETRLFLDGRGRGSIDPADGRMREELRSTDGPVDYLVHDPWRPAPSPAAPGPSDRSAIDARPDVLTFTAPIRETPLTLAGDVTAHLFLVSDMPSFDVCCVLSRVTASGQVFALAQGYCRVKQGETTAPLIIPMSATCATVGPGEALRLSIAGAAFPAYAINPGTGADPTATPLASASIITLGIKHGGSNPSHLVIPTVDPVQ
jgi:uncharacterized protein